MPDIRVTIPSETHFDLKVMALDHDKTLAKLVADVLSQAASSHHSKKAFNANRKPARKSKEPK